MTPVFQRRRSRASRSTLRAVARSIAGALLAAVWATGFGADFSLIIRAPAQEASRLSLDDIRALPSQEVEVKDEAGRPAHYRGIVLADVMTRGGARLPQLRGKTMTETLRVNAADGYAVVFALPELDADFTNALVLVCYEKDGMPLNDEEGPVRLVVPNEKKHARWVRRVSELAIQLGEAREN